MASARGQACNLARLIPRLKHEYYAHQPLRNTKMDVQIRLAEHPQGNAFVPIFIPDAEASDAVNFRGHLFFAEA